MSTPSLQIFVSKYHSPLKEPRILGEIADSKVEVGVVQNKPRISCNKKKVLKSLNYDENMSKPS